MEVAEFLRAVITTDAGNFCLAHRHGGNWSEQFMRWPEDLDRIVNQSVQMRARGDVYFSSHLFAEPNSHKKYVLPTRTIQADLDHADVATLSVLPTVITETSPGRHQAFWVTQTALDIPALEAVSRRIAYGVPDCDRTGWPAGKKVRLPDTYNYKREKEHLVEIVGVSLRELRLELFNAFPEITVSKEAAEKDVAWVDNEPDPLDVDSLELLRDVKQVIPPRVFSQYTKPASDRSAALWAFVTETLKAGCTREQVFWLARLNANNKFANRPNGDVDLRKDILRADAYLETRQVDIKAMLMDMRHKGNTHQAERFTKISEVVLNYMREQGEFVHTRGGSLYYLRSNTGRPMYISAHSEWMASYLNNVFGLNPTESVTKFVVSYLSSYCRGIPQAGELRALSHYDGITQKLMLHFGGRDVLHVASDSIDVQPNGYAGHVFYYNSIAEPITLGVALDVPWYEFMFGNAVNNLINLSRDEALAILASWTLFVLFRNQATTRPLLALLGAPGSGKTTIAKKVYRLIYGEYKSIGAITNSDNFDVAVSQNALVVYDNVDTWHPWLADSLAASTSDTDIEKRKLYTDADVVTLKRQAVVVLTAHNPRFTREDVVDRLLMLTFSRIAEFESESRILAQISSNRDRIWASIVQDIQKVLATPRPKSEEAPQFRMEDFAQLGLWFARALGLETHFVSAMRRLSAGQRSFNLEHDALLVNAITRMLEKQSDHEYQRIDVLHSILASCASDTKMFLTTYKLPQSLSRKLIVMQDSLNQIFDVDWRFDDNQITKLWRFAPRGVT